jgi:YD repeat-containing protein
MSVAYCSHCGHALFAGSSQCPGCGNPTSAAASTQAVSQVGPGTGIAKGILWALGALILCLAVVAVVVNLRIGRSEVFIQSLEAAQASPAVAAELGSGVHPVSIAIGLTTSFRGSEFAEWSVKLRGSRGAGHLYGVANRTSGAWEYSNVNVVAGGDGKRVDLMLPPKPLSFPPTLSKKVYLVPLGLENLESLGWAPEYYERKLGIDVRVLPAIALEPDLQDSKRHQLNADKCIDELMRQHPEIVRDPAALLIGVTSQDIFIPSFDWRFAENYRRQGRYAILSSARLHPIEPFDRWNPAWCESRLQKLLTKNLALLYFDLPMSNDPTSLVSGGVLSGVEIDQMGGQIVGPDGTWRPFLNQGDVAVTIYDQPGKPDFWRLADVREAAPDTTVEVFNANLTLGLLVSRKADFVFDGKYPLVFTRLHRNQDDRSRAFGIGGTDSLDMFLVGQMGTYIDLIYEDGSRAHFVRMPPNVSAGHAYMQNSEPSGDFTNAVADFDGRIWTITRKDGWKYYFPFLPRAWGQYVTALTSFTDPAGHQYLMTRNTMGELESITTPTGDWLHFENDAQHRIRSIASSEGRRVTYEYDAGGRLAQVKDSEGHQDTYAYDGKGEMLTAGHGSSAPVLTNTYSDDGYLRSQQMASGGRFEYSFYRGSGNILRESTMVDPDKLETYFEFGPGGYTQSLRRPRPY